MKKDSIYPIDKEIYKYEEEVRSNNFTGIQRKEEVNLFEYQKVSSAFTGVYLNENQY